MNNKESLEKVELNIYHNLCDISKVCRKKESNSRIN